ncbi:MAG TPA: tectonin domain-containing protein, partial [Polyangia bacterium]|nr:tectonin domain-containing protein [Polyangia bacterium]
MSRGSSYSGYVQLPADGGGVATDVGVGADGTAWMVSAGVYTVAPNDFAIKRWTGFGWGIVAGGGVRIAVDPHGAPWMVTSSRQIFRREGAAWVEHKLPGGAFDVGVGADGSVWAIGATPRGPHDFAVNRWLGASWETIDGGAVRIAVDPTGAPWIVNSSHQIFHREVNTWVRFPGEATDVGVGPDGKVWIITATPSGP